MTLNSINSIQKKAIAHTLYYIANADGIICDTEKMIFTTFHVFGYFSKTDIEESIHMSITDCATIIRELSNSQKEHLISNMISITSAGGENLDKVKAFMTVCKLADLTPPGALAKYL
ncbi:MAG: hypothetical protein JJU13_12520 [Balneolaceae bacterium]|nr:hypothetical protein [Balneolaceae bacterium]